MRKVLAFEKDELLADIAACCEVVAMGAGGDGHLVKDVLDDGNRELVERSIARHFSECVNMLHPFAKCVAGSLRDDNRLAEVAAYEMALDLDRQRSDTSIIHLKNCVHDYIVCLTATEWLTMAMPDAKSLPALEAKAAELREQIATALALPYSPARLRVKGHWY